MRKTLSCREMGVESCAFEVTSDKNDEIKDALMAHFGKVHPDIARGMSKDQIADMSRQMDGKLTS